LSNNGFVKILGATTALVVALTGLWMAVAGGGDPVPAVIIIRGSVLDADDGMTDSERDREWLLEQRTTTTDAIIDDS
jgi:hypothetical protein